MNIYHIVQWGNPLEGGNGEDGQCVVTARSFEEAVVIGESHFREWNTALGYPGYMRDRIHVVHLMGANTLPDDEAKVLLYRWVSSACNPTKMPHWVRQLNSDVWEKFE